MPKANSQKQIADKTFKVLFIGDIVARQGRKIVKKILPDLKQELKPDFVIANAENLTTGQGLTVKAVNEMIAAGIDFFTSGNHVWRKEEYLDELNKYDTPVIRPANYPKEAPGFGYKFIETKIGKIAVLNLLGKEHIRVIRYEPENPFLVVDDILKEIKKEKPAVILVDFHAEMTSERVAMGHYLDGQVTAVLGTHTHIPTADQRIFPNGTAFVSDVGMVGPVNSVIGVKKEIIIERFKSGYSQRFEVADGEGVFNSVLITLDKKGQAKKIERVDRYAKE